MDQSCHLSSFFFFNDTATTEIYTLSLHDALPIYATPCNVGPGPYPNPSPGYSHFIDFETFPGGQPAAPVRDRKSTRLNSSHSQISYAVFCLKKKTSIIWSARLATMA